MFIAKNATITCGGVKLEGLTVKSVSVKKSSEFIDGVFVFSGDSGAFVGNLDIDVVLSFPKIKMTKGRQPRFVNVWHEYRKTPKPAG